MTTTPPAPTPTANTDADPCPRIEVLITTMPVDAVSVTIWRSWAGRRVIVPGAKNTPVSGDFLIIDYVAPFGTPVTYTCQTVDDDGGVSDLSDPSDPVTLDVDDVWVQDPLDPATSMALGFTRSAPMLEGASFSSFTYSLDASINPVTGSQLPVAFGGTRQAGSAVPLIVVTWSTDDADTFRDLVTQTFPLCVRTPARVSMVDGLTYLASPDVVEQLQRDGKTTFWTLNGASVAGPGIGVIVSPRTYDDADAEASTYADFLTLYATYVDLKRG